MATPSPHQPSFDFAYKDASDLKILQILFYVMAGLSAFVILFWLLISLVGVSQVAQAGSAKSGDIAAFVFLAIATLVFTVWTLLLLAVGLSIRARKRRIFCIVVAALCCLSFPIGTALGIYAIVVLSRPTVRQLFESQSLA